MSGARLVECLRILGVKRTWLAREAHCSEGLIRSMEKNRRAVPQKLADWLEGRVSAHLADPAPPDDWKDQLAGLRRKHQERRPA